MECLQVHTSRPLSTSTIKDTLPPTFQFSRSVINSFSRRSGSKRRVYRGLRGITSLLLSISNSSMNCQTRVGDFDACQVTRLEVTKGTLAFGINMLDPNGRLATDWMPLSTRRLSMI